MSRTAKYVDVVLDKPRRLLYNLNAMAAYERETGKNFMAISEEKMSATIVRAILWAGLVHEDKDLTVEQVGEMMSTDNMLAIQEKVLLAMTANAPVAKAPAEPAESGQETPPLAAAPTESAS